MKALRVVGAVLAVFLIVYALAVATDASTTARDTSDQLAQNNYVRARAACTSSTELRSLLNDLDSIITGASRSPTNPALVQFSQRIHRYTDHNPNCKHLPPKP